MNRAPLRTTDVVPALEDDRVHIVEGDDEDRGLAWTATVAAIDSETAETVDALPVALQLAAAGQMLEALMAVQAEASLRGSKPKPAKFSELF